MNRVSNYRSSTLSTYIDKLRRDPSLRPLYPFRVARTIRSAILISDVDKKRLSDGEIDCYVNRSGLLIIVEPSLGQLSDIIWDSGIGEMSVNIIGRVIDQYLTILISELGEREKNSPFRATIENDNLTELVSDLNDYISY